MSSSPLPRLRRLWRAWEPTLWPDVALAAALSLAAVWLTILAAEPSGSDVDVKVDVPRQPEFWPVPVPNVPYPRLTPPGEPVGRDVLMTLLITVPLVGRRRWPLVCLIVQFAGMLPFDIPVTPATLAALLIGAFSLAVHGRSALVSMSTLLVVGAVTAAVKEETWPSLPGWSGAFALLLPIGLFGVAIRAARGQARASHQRAEALEREQEAATSLAVAQERARIARELHDVVSHHVSVMTIQAGAAGKVLDADPELARGAMSAIEASGRETMTELRHLLGVLTPGPSEDDLLHPQPGLEQLDALVENVRRAGQPVSVRRTSAALPRGVDLTAYRVVQEALTNALRYAPGAPTEVAITTEPSPAPTNGASPLDPLPPDPLPPDRRSDLVIEVVNDEAPPDARSGGSGHGGTGRGLLGLAERLRLYGGTLESGRRLGGGFRVRARMPLEPRASRNELDNPLGAL
ncbi:histidine kinase [Actinopolymorpha pittospori]|uniref:histidine kinase n=1 Tax=Actinopolymorpha pittospori TaxID=648752 RepID=A0A927N033_9ACTN|nr:signal transduction histidine kinase [Actinopolymorpha pittospori]